MAKNTICIWYDKDAEAAARFYAETFPDSAVHAVHRLSTGVRGLRGRRPRSERVDVSVRFQDAPWTRLRIG